jgi:putative PEP-CTERM system TPR-repeat lipoprotein
MPAGRKRICSALHTEMDKGCLLARVGLLCLTLSAAACATDPNAQKQEFFASGDKYFNDGNFDAAVIQYRNAIEIDPRFGRARARLADAYQRQGDARRAFEEFVRAADLLPDDAAIQVTAGTYLLAARRPEDALARAEVALKLAPDNVQALLLRGNALAGLNSFDEALESVEEAIQLDPSRGATYAHLGLLEMARGRRQDAEEAFKKAVALAPKVVDSHLSLGNYYWASGRLAEAEQAFQNALALEADNASANRAMAAFTLDTGRQAEAEQYLKRLAATEEPAAALALVDYYLMLGRSQEAIARLEALTTKGRNIPGAAHRLARAHAIAGDLTKAKSLVDSILRASPRDVEAQLFRSELLLREGDRDAAFAAVAAAAAADPASVPAQFALGRLHSARGDNAAAQSAFAEVLRLNPRAAAAQLELSRLQLAAGQAGASLRSAEEASKSNPDSAAARVALVRSLIAAKDLDRAGRELAAVRAAYPNAAEVHTLTGTLAMQRNDAAAARASFTRAQEIAPESLEALAGLIALDLKENNAATARGRIEQRVKQRATPELLLLAARTYWSLDDLSAAERTLRQAIDAEPSMLAPYAMLGQLYMRQQKLDQARAEFDALAAKQSRPVGALTMSGIISQVQNNLPLARKRFEEALAVDGDAVIAANNLAWMHAEQGDNLDVALRLAQTAAAAAPDVPEVLDTLGWVYYKKDLPRLAVAQFQRAVEKAPGNASYLHHLGLAHLQAGDTGAGRAALQMALSAKPSSAAAAEIRRALAAATAARQ